jgi:uncharacterized protein (DUF169 family)
LIEKMSLNLELYQEIGNKIEQLIRPATFPLAIKLIKSQSEIPPGSKRPKDLNLQNFLCQDFKMARSYGWTMAVTEEDCNCRLARGVFGWDPQTEETIEFAHQFNIGLYAKDLETSKKFEKNLYFLENKFWGLVISPLVRTKIEPDVVLIYCLPAQAMRLIQGYLYCEGGVMQFTAAGRIGSCHDGVIKAFLTKKPQLVILGNGDRVWGGAQDAEVMFSCPKDKLNILIEGLEATHAAGLRYPIPTYMNYKPGFQRDFQKKAYKRARGTLVKEKELKK